MVAVLPFLIAASLVAATPVEDREYTFMHFLVHPQRPQLPADKAQKVQAEHLENLGTLGRAGKLIAAGPMENAGRIRGICILVVPPDEVRTLMSKDATVRENLLVVETLRWKAPVGFTGKAKEPMELTQAGLAYFNKGPRWETLLPAASETLWKEHEAFCASLASEGKILVRGPVLDEHHRREILICRSDNAAEVEALLAASPAVKGGLLAVEAYRWWYGKGTLPAKDGD